MLMVMGSRATVSSLHRHWDGGPPMVFSIFSYLHLFSLADIFICYILFVACGLWHQLWRTEEKTIKILLDESFCGQVGGGP